MYVHKFVYHDDIGHEGGDGEWAGKVKVLNTNSDTALVLIDKLKKDTLNMMRTEDEIKANLQKIINKN